jgi:glycine dehydrogenase subunit 2
MASIVQEIEENPDLVLEAPHAQKVERLDEVKANRTPILRHYVEKKRV